MSNKTYPFPNKKAHQKGRRAFYKNLENPYPDGSDESHEWWRGFNEAYWENYNRLQK